jgi:type I restriction enzyme M protein
MKEFTRIFNLIAYRHDFMRVFDDFLTMAICCFSFGKMEEVYFQTIKGYSKEELIHLSHLIGALIEDYEKKSDSAGCWYDGLGDFFMENNSKFGQDARGQFFTPEPVCEMMAQISKGEDEKEERFINDPACGSGRMLIAFDRIHPGNRFKNFYVGNDLDLRCVKMCVLNMFLYGLKGAVIHMNSLSMDVYSGYRIYLPDTRLGIRPLNKNQCMQYLLQPKGEEPEQAPETIKTEPIKIIQEFKPEKAQQLTLF